MSVPVLKGLQTSVDGSEICLLSVPFVRAFCLCLLSVSMYFKTVWMLKFGCLLVFQTIYIYLHPPPHTQGLLVQMVPDRRLFKYKIGPVSPLHSGVYTCESDGLNVKQIFRVTVTPPIATTTTSNANTGSGENVPTTASSGGQSTRNFFANSFVASLFIFV